MSVAIPLEEGENLRSREALGDPRTRPSELAVSDRALFLPAKRKFSLLDDRYFRRVPLPEVQSVVLRQSPMRTTWAVAALLIVVGLALPRKEWKGTNGSRTTFTPSAFAVVGILLPLSARGRCTLVISFTPDSFSWQPPPSLWNGPKKRGLEVQERILEACRGVGLYVSDERAVA